MSDREFIGVDPARTASSDSTHTTVITVTPPPAHHCIPGILLPPMDRVDICGANDCGDIIESTESAKSTGLALSDVAGPTDPLATIGDRVYPPASSLTSILVSKGSHAVTPVLPNGVQWLQAGRRYAAYKGNVHLGGIDPVATGDPSSPLWVAYAKGSRNEPVHDSLCSAMEWVMVNAAEPARLITDILQEHIGPINLKLDADGYRVALRRKGTDNQLCIYMFDNRNATSQELRVNLGLVPPEPVNAIAWLDAMIRGLKAGLQLYRDWANVPGIEVEEEPRDPDPLSIRGEVSQDVSYKQLVYRSVNPRLDYVPPTPDQVIEPDPLAAAAMPPMPNLDGAVEDEKAGRVGRDASGLTIDPRGGPMDGITFMPRERAAWDEEDEEQE